MKNMKIEINDTQPLDEVVGELDRLGYRCACKSVFGAQTITTWNSGHYHEVGLPVIMVDNGELTTLAELKEMK